MKTNNFRELIWENLLMSTKNSLLCNVWNKIFMMFDIYLTFLLDQQGLGNGIWGEFWILEGGDPMSWLSLNAIIRWFKRKLLEPESIFKAKNEKLVKTMFASEILLIFNSFKIIGSHLKKVIPCKNCAAHSELSLTNNGLFKAEKIFI